MVFFFIKVWFVVSPVRSSVIFGNFGNSNWANSLHPVRRSVLFAAKDQNLGTPTPEAPPGVFQSSFFVYGFFSVVPCQRRFLDNFSKRHPFCRGRLLPGSLFLPTLSHPLRRVPVVSDGIGSGPCWTGSPNPPLVANRLLPGGRQGSRAKGPPINLFPKQKPLCGAVHFYLTPGSGIYYKSCLFIQVS